MKKIIYSKVLGSENESTHTLFQGFCQRFKELKSIVH